MALFKKREERKIECAHKYKDFPWYVCTETCDTRVGERYRVYVKESYVCVHCGNRIDKVLSTYGDYYYKSDATKIAKKLRDEYAEHIKDMAVIEDMINDMILVDQQYLRFYEMVKGGKIELPKLELK